MSSVLSMTAPPDVYRRRRKDLAASLTRPIVLMAGRAMPRHYLTNTLPFRAGSNYLYFGGPPIEGAALLIEPGSDGDAGCTLFRTPAHFEETVWVGAVPDDDALAQASGVSPAHFATPDELGARFSGRAAGVAAPPCPTTKAWSDSLGLSALTDDEMLAIIDLRLYKDEHELAAMRRAAKAGVAGHLAVMKAIAPGKNEAQIAAAMFEALVAHRCNTSFSPIVTVHGEVLHAGGFVYDLHEGNLLLCDSGAEEPGGYASDITRTSPVSGSFTSIQRALYDTVLRAERECIAACVPGRRYRDVHDLAGSIICEGLVEAGLLKGNPAELSERRAHTLFMTHGVGHLIGLDVHDMEDFGDLAGYERGRERRPAFGDKFLRLDRDLAPGMAVTVEPGIYFVPALWGESSITDPFADCVSRDMVDQLLGAEFGGIRIEDTIVVREADAGGPENLTAELPTDADEIAQIVRG